MSNINSRAAVDPFLILRMNLDILRQSGQLTLETFVGASTMLPNGLVQLFSYY